MRQDHFDAAFLLGQMTQAQKDQARRSDSHERRLDTQHVRLDDHNVRLTALERRKPRSAPGRGQRAALVTALWTAAAGTAWHADSIAARLLGLIGR
jgi:hypothetical protein